MASASKATRVMVMTSPRVRRRRAGAHTPSSLGDDGRWREHRGVVEGHGLHAATLPEPLPQRHRAGGPMSSVLRPRSLACCPAHGGQARAPIPSTSGTTARTRRSSGSCRTSRPPTRTSRRWSGRSTTSTRRCSGSRATARASRSGRTTARPPDRLGPTTASRVHAIERGWLERMRACRALRVPVRGRRVRAVARRRRLLGVRRRARRRSTSRRSATCSSGTASAASSCGSSPTCGRSATP